MSQPAHPSPSDQLPISRADAEMETLTEPLIFYQNVSPSKELRDAANAAEVLLREYGIGVSMRLDVYQAKANAEKNIKASGRKLNPEEERLVEKLILDGKRAGLDLPDKERNELEKLKKELSQTCVEFSVSFVLVLLYYLLKTQMNRKTLMKRMYTLRESRVFRRGSRVFLN
jgi:Zn-dependent oligopeptidase